MTKTRLLSTMALALALLLPGPAALGQDASPAVSAAPAAPIAPDDPRLAELEALLPPALAGLPLAENLTLRSGEEVLSLMPPHEATLLQDFLDEQGKTSADYAVAATWLQTSETDIVILQAHRIAGVDAADAIATWVELLSLGLPDPESSQGFIGGRPVTLVSDASNPDAPLVHLFPAGDVTWMMVAADEAIIRQAMEATS